MTPPIRKPWFADAVGGTEVTFPDTAADMGWTIERLATTARTHPHWRLHCDDLPPHPIRLEVLESVPRESVRIGFACNGITGTIAARPDPSGFVLVVVEVAGVEWLRAYLDRPYEEYDLFPPGDRSEPGSEGPGRMSKNLWWLSLSAEAWPALRQVTSSGAFCARVPD